MMEANNCEELLYRLKHTQRLFTVWPMLRISINFIGLPCSHMRGAYAYLLQFLKILSVANGKLRYLFAAILKAGIWRTNFYSIIVHNWVILSSKQILDGRTLDRPTHRAKLYSVDPGTRGQGTRGPGTQGPRTQGPGTRDPGIRGPGPGARGSNLAPRSIGASFVLASYLAVAGSNSHLYFVFVGRRD